MHLGKPPWRPLQVALRAYEWLAFLVLAVTPRWWRKWLLPVVPLPVFLSLTTVVLAWIPAGMFLIGCVGSYRCKQKLRLNLMRPPWRRSCRYSSSLGQAASGCRLSPARVDSSHRVGIAFCSARPASVVFARVAVQAQVSIGMGVILNTGCSVDHEAQLADGVIFAQDLVWLVR